MHLHVSSERGRSSHHPQGKVISERRPTVLPSDRMQLQHFKWMPLDRIWMCNSSLRAYQQYRHVATCSATCLPCPRSDNVSMENVNLEMQRSPSNCLEPKWLWIRYVRVTPTIGFQWLELRPKDFRNEPKGIRELVEILWTLNDLGGHRRRASHEPKVNNLDTTRFRGPWICHERCHHRLLTTC